MISRAQEPEQLYAEGGITSIRQPYFLGKAVKKLTKGVKKIAKSPLGKAALIGGGLWGLNKWGPLAGKISPMFSGGWDKFKGLGFGKQALLGLGAAGMALPFMADEEEVVEELPWETTPDSIANIRNMARNRDPSLAFMPRNEYVQSGYYLADGGRAGLMNGGGAAEAQAENMLKMEYQKYRNQGGTMSYQQFKMAVLQQAQGQGPMAQGPAQMAASGGRIGFYPGGPAGGASAGGNYGGDSSGGDYQGAGAGRSVAQGGRFGNSYDDRGTINPLGYPGGTTLFNVADGPVITSNNQVPLSTLDKMKSLWSGLRKTTSSPEEDDSMNVINTISNKGSLLNKAAIAVNPDIVTGEYPNNMTRQEYLNSILKAHGGRVGRAEGGIMPLLDLGGKEKDYRQDGGFVGIGRKERADDVPARLSKNEFVFTADAVRNAGGGDIDAGAEVMDNMMKHLESGGQISEESQGGGGEEMISEEEMIQAPDGAQEMYEQQAMLQSRMA